MVISNQADPPTFMCGMAEAAHNVFEFFRGNNGAAQFITFSGCCVRMSGFMLPRRERLAFNLVKIEALGSSHASGGLRDYAKVLSA